MSEYYGRLRQLRLENKLSQTEVARKIGVQQNTLSEYECGVRTVPVDILLKLAKLYQVSVEYLCGITERRN